MKNQTGKSILQHLFWGYLKLLEKTVKIQWRENQVSADSQIFGFWHEDSFFMNLVLKELAGKTAPIDVIVTSDTRGDYIEYMLGECGGHALRVPDGFAAFGKLKELLQSSHEKERSLAVALDGPLGPRHEPKKVAFYMSQQSHKNFLGISVSYSTCLRLFWRWDKYVIPLPFSTIIISIHDYGEVSKNQIPILPVDAEISDCGILLKDA